MQVRFTDAQFERLKTMASEEGISVAELVRRCIDAMLEAHENQTREALKRGARQVIGKYSSGLPDVGVNHD